MRTIYRVRTNSGRVIFRTSDPLTAGAYAAASNGAQTVTYTPSKFEIELLKARGMNSRIAEQEAMGTAGVYNVAYFGHKGTDEDRRIVRAISEKIHQVFHA